jgi:hypothetical protein
MDRRPEAVPSLHKAEAWQARSLSLRVSVSILICPPQREISRSVSMGLKSLPQPLHFKAGAKQREQTSEQYHAALDGQENVDVAIKLGEVPEDGDAEKRAAEDEAEFAQKQKYVIENQVRTPKWDWNIEHSAPKRDFASRIEG